MSAPLVVGYSIILLIAAFSFSYVVFLIEAQRSTPDELPSRVAAGIAHASDKLVAEFNDLQSHDPNVPGAPGSRRTLALTWAVTDTGWSSGI